MKLQHKDLLEARVHLGHLTSKWHPNMLPYIFMERKGIHIIDLNKTLFQLQEATQALQGIAKQGKKILFVATKRQAKNAIEQEAKRLKMPYITERWLGGTMTNFATIRRLIKKMTSFDKLMKDSAYKNMAKKEQLMIAREKAKLERLLKGLEDTTRLPGALVIVDTQKEHIAVKEAQKLGIPIFAISDTNSNPDSVEYPIPGNDDATSSIEIIVKALGVAIESGLEERKDNQLESQETTAEVTKREKKAVKVTIPETTAKPAKKTALKGSSTLTKATPKKQAGTEQEVVEAKDTLPKTTTKASAAPKKIPASKTVTKESTEVDSAKK